LLWAIEQYHARQASNLIATLADNGMIAPWVSSQTHPDLSQYSAACPAKRLACCDQAPFFRSRSIIEALAKANRIAFEGWQRLVRRQAKMLQETMKKVVSDAGREDAKKKRADLAKEGFEKALANMRELA
jgi:hypothetical protein